MDSLAALALATELPSRELLNRSPYGRKKPIISRTMMKNILGHAFYQLIVVFVLVYKGHELFSIDSGSTGGSLNAAPSQHYTIVFNTFVIMTLFNMLNSRKIHGERNVFERLFSNPLFVGIWIVCFAAQAVIVEFGGVAFSTSNLDASQWLWCIFLGFGVLLWGQVIASIPAKKLPTKLVVGAGDVSEPMPLMGLQSMEPDLLLEPCEDRTGDGLWMWSFTRIQTKMRVVQAFRDSMHRPANLGSPSQVVRRSLQKLNAMQSRQSPLPQVPHQDDRDSIDSERKPPADAVV